MLPIFEKITLQQGVSSIKFFERKERYFPGYWHFHPEMELTYIIKGEGLRYVGDSIARFQAGDLVLLGKNIPHNWESHPKDSQTGAEAVVFQFSENLFSVFPEFNSFDSLINEAKSGIQFKPERTLVQAIEYLSHCDPSLRLIKFLEVCHNLTSVDSQRLSGANFSLPKFSEMESRINKVKGYIDSRIKSSINLPEVADHMQMTEGYFCRWFKKRTGHSLVQYVNKLKIELVCRDLIVTDKGISVIAYENGFENISHFNRTFKQTKNISPREYRNRNGYKMKPKRAVGM